MTIDTRMNGVIHAALRRDLERTALLVERPDDLSPARLQAIGAHAVWLMELLHRHHTTEDERLFPVMRANKPDVGPLIDAMLAEHGAIASAVTTLEEAGRRAEAGEPGAAQALGEAVAGLRRVLDPHLEHEERSLSPLVAGSVTEEEWAVFEKGNTQGVKPPDARLPGPLDARQPRPGRRRRRQDAGPGDPALRHAALPRRRLPQAVRRLWGGTPAVAVRSRPLTPL